MLKLDFPLSVDGLTCRVARPGQEKVPVIVGSMSKSVERRRFQRLVLRALAEDIISLPKAAELLRKSTGEVSRIMSGPAG